MCKETGYVWYIPHSPSCSLIVLGILIALSLCLRCKRGCPTLALNRVTILSCDYENKKQHEILDYIEQLGLLAFGKG